MNAWTAMAIAMVIAITFGAAFGAALGYLLVRVEAKKGRHR